MVDTRQQEGKHALKHAQLAERYKLARTKLYVGDYMLVGGTVAIDTKRDIRELASCLRQGHERFRAELVRARDAGIELWVLTETGEVGDLAELAEWTEPSWSAKRHGGTAPLEGRQLARTAATMRERYGAHFAFCRPEAAGEAVAWILEEEKRS